MATASATQSDTNKLPSEGCAGEIGVVFPVALRRVRVRGGRRRVGDPCRRHDARGHPAFLGLLEEVSQLVSGGAGRIAAGRAFVESDDARSRFCASQDGGHRSGRIGNLLVRVVGLRQGDVGTLLEREAVRLAGPSLELSLEDPRRRDRGKVHPVPDEDDHVLGARTGRLQGPGAFYRFPPVSEPFFGALSRDTRAP